MGVAFYLAAGIRSQLRKNCFFSTAQEAPNLKQFLDFVAIGTIADLVPLTGVNRILVKAGFEALRATAHPGIEELLLSCDISRPGKMTSDDIAFQLAPKLNAAGRMGEGGAAVELLISSERKKAKALTKELSRLNILRRKTCADNLELTVTFDRKKLIYEDACVVHLDRFHPGVVGIVASQLVELLDVPVILLAEVKNRSGEVIIKGSGRATEDINLFECLRECRNFLNHFGGHKGAAGISLERENIKDFKKAFSRIIRERRGAGRVRTRRLADLEIPVDTLFKTNILEELYLLEPYGEGNGRPLFFDKKPLVYSCKTVGKDAEHIKIRVRGRYGNHEGIGFGLGKKIRHLKEKRESAIIYTPMLNRFQHSSSWKVKVLDIL